MSFDNNIHQLTRLREAVNVTFAIYHIVDFRSSSSSSHKIAKVCEALPDAHKANHSTEHDNYNIAGINLAGAYQGATIPEG